MQNGWIKLHRQIMENELYYEDRFSKAHAWIDLLLLAGHKERVVSIRNVSIKLQTGELAYSQKTLAERWQWNRRTVRKFLRELENRGMIHNRISKVTTVISIKNWQKWQGDAQQENSAQQKSAEMHNRDTQQEIVGTGSNNGNITSVNGKGAQEKSTKNRNGVHTNKNVEQEAAASDEKEFYKFVREFVAGCRNNGTWVNENAVVLKLREPYQKYGDEQMRRCFNDVIGKALKKKKTGERVRDIVSYGKEVLEKDYKPINQMEE